VVLEEGDGGFEHRGLVHLLVGRGHHGAQLVDEHVELVPTLLLTQVTIHPAHEHRVDSTGG